MTNITTFIKACLITDLLGMNFLNEPFILNKTRQDTVPVSFMTNELFQTDLFAIVTQKIGWEWFYQSQLSYCNKKIYIKKKKWKKNEKKKKKNEKKKKNKCKKEKKKKERNSYRYIAKWQRDFWVKCFSLPFTYTLPRKKKEEKKKGNSTNLVKKPCTLSIS